MTLMETLDRMKKAKRANHEAILQIKIPRTLRDELRRALKQDGLDYKDVLLASIEVYLKERATK